MVINPQRAINEGWVKLCEYSKVQQSGIDITLKNIKSLDGTLSWTDEKFFLSKGHYDFECNEYVKVPQNCIALLIIRSSFNRKGAFITTGLYDNGFENFIGGVIHLALPLEIKKNERIAQIVFMQTEHKAQYCGQYQKKR